MCIQKTDGYLINQNILILVVLIIQVLKMKQIILSLHPLFCEIFHLIIAQLNHHIHFSRYYNLSLVIL